MTHGLLRWLSGKESTSNVEDVGSIPGPGRSPGEGIGNPFQLAWEISWTEEPGRLQSMELQKSDTTEKLNHHHHHKYSACIA